MSNAHNHGSFLYIINVHTENLGYHYYPVKITSLSSVRILSINEAHICEVLFLLSTYKGKKIVAVAGIPFGAIISVMPKLSMPNCDIMCSSCNMSYPLILCLN